MPDYDPERISIVVREGLAELGLLRRVRGRVVIKPNVVMAHKKIAPSAYTRPEFMDGVLRALRGAGPAEASFTIVEKSGAGLPTPRIYRRAGYAALRKTHPVRLLAIEEAPKTIIPLLRGRLHDHIVTAPEIADNDFLVYAPKLKTNYLTQGLTAAVKLNIGILRDRQRMWNHNSHLDEKIVDCLEIGFPDFIATDAVEIGFGGNQFTEHGRPLGLVILADDPLAHDVVCARLLHLDPRSIGHLAEAERRGYGSLDPARIDVSGDLTLAAAMDRTKDWDVHPIRVEESQDRMKVLSGEPYCSGGCHGVFLDWLYMIKDRKPKLWTRLPRWTVVIGEYKGDVEARRVLLLGSCTKVVGTIKARTIRRIRGCPPKHKALVLSLFLKARIWNPLIRPELVFDGYIYQAFALVRRFLKGRIG
jgi:uncharacterized protein (DUF362 family)